MLVLGALTAAHGRVHTRRPMPDCHAELRAGRPDQLLQALLLPAALEPGHIPASFGKPPRR
jgi:hypothetical protein